MDLWSKELLFYLNGKRIVVADAAPGTTLLEFLRSPRIGLHGTKLGCGEGACGACTVMISRWNPVANRPVHKAIDSCLTPLCAVDGAYITTVEGLGTTKNPHQVQARLADMHGSQCGFCTPGFVMSIHSYLSEHPEASPAELEGALDGNLCRCTGYRPILDAAKSLTACDGKGGCGCKEDKKHDLEDAHMCLSKRVFGGQDQADAFPEELKKERPSLQIMGPHGSLWFAPKTLHDLLLLKKHHPHARIIVGNSEVGVEQRFKGVKVPIAISPVGVPELNAFSESEESIIVGGSLPLSDLEDKIAALKVATKTPEQLRRLSVLLAVGKQLKYFACRQIRNTACLGGNITTSSPTSDLSPVFLACDCIVHAQSAERGRRTIKTSDFFLGYRKVAIAEDEIVVAIEIPKLSPNGVYVQAYKVSRRKEDDIHIGAACFRVVLEPSEASVTVDEVDAPKPAMKWINPALQESKVVTQVPQKDEFKAPALQDVPCKVPAKVFKVKDASLAFGSMAVKTSLAPGAAKFLIGKSWSSKELIPGVFEAIEKDLPLSAGVPGGMVEYRRALVKSLFVKFFLEVSAEIYGKEYIPDPYLTALGDLWDKPGKEGHHEVSRGEQDYDDSNDTSPVGVSMPHLAARKQTTGEALFTDDIPEMATGLHGALVQATKAHAKIKKIDISKAMAVPGVVDVVLAKDVPGKNDFEGHEEIFASEDVLYFGQPIGIVVAETHKAAREAAMLVHVEYDVLKPILTIHEALKEKSFMSPVFTIQRGNPQEALAKSAHVIEGEMFCGAQEHFYLETQACYVVPTESGEYDVTTSTQNPNLTQLAVAEVLGISANKIIARVKRAGGGFGGKEARSAPYSCACAIAAAKHQRPVRLIVDRDVDMSTSGLRHPFLIKYKAGFSANGKVEALDYEIYSNGGFSPDLSVPVLHRALFHVDNAYYCPNLKAIGQVCKTNRMSNTAFRGFGGPQGMMVVETIFERMAQIMGVEPAKLREQNFYVDGQTTHYGKEIVDSKMAPVWQEIMARTDYEARKADIAKFNASSRFVKRGISTIPVKFGLSFTHPPLNQAGSLVLVYLDGSVLVSHGGCEIGQGLHTKMAQVAARALGIPVSLVHIAETATDKVANASATAASMQADLNGMAVLDAGTQIRKRLDEFMATMPGSKDWSWTKLVTEAYNHRIDLAAHGFYRAVNGYDWSNHTGDPFAYYTYGAACSEVEVDTLTGEHRVIRADVVMDLGQSLNPALDVGQVEGAFIQGVGWSTTEEILTLSDGRQFTLGPSTYKVPAVSDVPRDMRIHLLRGSKNKFAVHSSKGVGEPPLFLGSSVFFAIKEAVRSARKDVGIDEYFQMHHPATVERIRLACKDGIVEPACPRQSTWSVDETPLNPPDYLVPCKNQLPLLSP